MSWRRGARLWVGRPPVAARVSIINICSFRPAPPQHELSRPTSASHSMAAAQSTLGAAFSSPQCELTRESIARDSALAAMQRLGRQLSPLCAPSFGKKWTTFSRQRGSVNMPCYCLQLSSRIQLNKHKCEEQTSFSFHFWCSRCCRPTSGLHPLQAQINLEGDLWEGQTS